VALASNQAQLYSFLQAAYDDLRATQQAVTQQERLRAVGQMASGIAHDINNAISPITVYTESLLDTEPNLSHRTRKYLETIQRASDDVAQTVSRMRELYRQREPQMTLRPVLLNELVRQALDLTRVRWNDMPQQQGLVIEATAELAAVNPMTMGVESEIREALVNLIFNAVDAMPNGGKLTLRTGVTSSPADPSVSTIYVEVLDTGVGMDEETRRRCLEPFYTTKGERGTGLGLAMVYGIVERHSAEIEIDSVVGRGTAVRLKFNAAARTTEPVSTSRAPSVTGLRILVIDDDPLVQKTLADTLEAEGHHVTTANGGQAGIDAFRASSGGSQPFSLVITDLGMPYVDGRKVAAGIKAASPATPVILLTGWGQSMTEDRDIPPYVDLLLSKPARLRELRGALAQLFPPPK